MVPSTDASKENTCEATFALMPMCFIQHKCYQGSKGTVKNFWVHVRAVPVFGVAEPWGQHPVTLETWVIQPPRPLALRVEHSHDPPE